MTIENEVKKLREAVEANTAAIQAHGIGGSFDITPEQAECLDVVPAVQAPIEGGPLTQPGTGTVPGNESPVQPLSSAQPVQQIPQQPVQQPAIAAGPSADEVNALLVAEAERIGSQGPAQIVAVLTRYGNTKITLIDPGYYPQILGEIAQIPAGA